jgi:hypothetical protein
MKIRSFWEIPTDNKLIVQKFKIWQNAPNIKPEDKNIQ